MDLGLATSKPKARVNQTQRDAAALRGDLAAVMDLESEIAGESLRRHRSPLAGPISSGLTALDPLASWPKPCHSLYV